MPETKTSHESIAENINRKKNLIIIQAFDQSPEVSIYRTQSQQHIQSSQLITNRLQ